MYIRPRTSRSRSSVTQELMAQADKSDYVGMATWFISHTWSNMFSDTLESILLFFEGRDDAEQAKVWFLFFLRDSSTCERRAKQAVVMVDVHVSDQHWAHWQAFVSC